MAEFERMVPAPPLPTVLGTYVWTSPPPTPQSEVLRNVTGFLAQVSAAHQDYLRTSAALHTRFLDSRRPLVAPRGLAPRAVPAMPSPPALGRRELEAHGSGDLSAVLGPLFSSLDGRRHQVRLPMPPLLLVDRVTRMEGAPGSMGQGAIWTETDVLDSSWWLDDCGRMPHGMVSEAAQAFMVLLGWLGADLAHDGDRVYRMVGTDCRFLGERPRAGETLAFEIHTDGEARLGETRIVFANAIGRVGGEPRASGRVQAGLFRPEELERPAGAPWSPAGDRRALEGPCDPPALRCGASSFSRSRVLAFANGHPAECFGEGFERTETHVRTPKIPAGRLLMLDEVEAFEPDGGPWRRGYLRASRAIAPDEWFFAAHFLNDPCMPGSLVIEGALQAMAFHLTAMGHTVRRDGWRFDLERGRDYSVRWQGQVTPRTRALVYEVFVESVVAGPEPVLVADVVMSADGKQSFHTRRLRMRLVPDVPLEHWQRAGPPTQQLTGEPVPLSRLGGLAGHREARPVARVDGFDYGQASLMAMAWGRASRALGPRFEVYDSVPGLPRLPGPPYQVMSRVAEISAEPGVLRAGVSFEAEYDVPPRVWYLAENGAPVMPWAVLLETLLQPCGWLSGFTSLDGSRFAAGQAYRNLDGTATVLAEVGPATGTLRTRVRLESHTKLADLTLYTFTVGCVAGGVTVARASTDFGYFPKEAFEQQVGLPAIAGDDELLTAPSAFRLDLTERPARIFEGPLRLPGPMLLMLDRVTGFWPEGGRAGLGLLRAERDIRPSDWYFKAHFLGDPVQPGSLGLEGVCQLLQIYAIETGLGQGVPRPRFESPMRGRPLTWKYRGQVLPENRRVITELEVTEVGRDERGPFAVGEGWLRVDGLRVYHVKDLGLRVVSGSACS